MKNKFIIASLSFIIGIILQTFVQLENTYLFFIPMIIGVIFAGYIFINEKNWKQLPFTFTILSFALIFISLGIIRTRNYGDQSGPRSLNSFLQNTKTNQELEIIGQIAAEPELRGNGTGDLVIEVRKIKKQNSKFFTDIAPSKIALKLYSSKSKKENLFKLIQPETYGYTIKFKVKYRPLYEPRNPGEFNYKYYLFQNDLNAAFKTSFTNLEIIEQTKGNFITEFALKIKLNFIETYKRTITAPASKLISGATIGTRRAIEKTNYKVFDITEMFRRAGVGHILAVSGLHVSIVALLLFTLFTLTGMKPQIYAPIVISFLIIFAIITGARPSTIRAVIMNSVTIIAFSYFRYNLRNATYIGLSVSSLFILIFNPPVLYSASFLLSFGAVLSLVTLTPLLDRLICSLTGFSFIFTLIWFLSIFYLAIRNIGLFTLSANIIIMFLTLYLAIYIGGRLNYLFPKICNFSFRKLHISLRSLLIAQLSIQIGMMIPLNAWFFGQFPVAGILVNLAAIPLVGILVQLGIITGLLGLIPFIGQYIALPFGAAASLFGDLFLYISYLGANNFPYPALPKPTLNWMIFYYGILFTAVILFSNITKIQNYIYIFKSRNRKFSLIITSTLSAILITFAILTKFYFTDKSCTGILINHNRNFPAVSIISNKRSSVLINPGDSYTASRIVFEGIRHYGAYKSDSVIIAGFEYNSGYEGIPDLSEKILINNIFIPVKSENYNTLASEIGDPYILENIDSTNKYLQRTKQSYNKLLKNYYYKTNSIPSGEFIKWSNISISGIENYNNQDKYITSAKTPFLEINYQGHTILIVTDALDSSFENLNRNYDILILPYLPYNSYYSKMVVAAIKNTNPNLVIITNGKKTKYFSYGFLKNNFPEIDIWTTEYTGAVFLKLDNNVLNVKSFSTNKNFKLKGDISHE